LVYNFRQINKQGSIIRFQHTKHRLKKRNTLQRLPVDHLINEKDLRTLLRIAVVVLLLSIGCTTLGILILIIELYP